MGMGRNKPYIPKDTRTLKQVAEDRVPPPVPADRAKAALWAENERHWQAVRDNG